MIQAPVRPIQIQMHKPPVRRKRSHVQHRRVRENVRHVEPPVHHVVRPVPQLDLIELLRRRQPALKSRKQRKPQLPRSILTLETDPVTLLRKIRERPAKQLRPARYHKTRPARRINPLQGPHLVTRPVNRHRPHRHAHARHLLQRIHHLRRIKRIRRNRRIQPPRRTLRRRK